MTKTAKVLLWIGLIAMLFVAGLVVLTWRFVSANKDAWVHKGTEAVAEGELAGQCRSPDRNAIRGWAPKSFFPDRVAIRDTNCGRG